MTKASGGARIRGNGKENAMERTAFAELDLTAMEEASEDLVGTSASATALGGQAHTGARPPLPFRPSLRGAPQQGPHDAPCCNAMTEPRPSQTHPIQRRELQPVEVHRTPAKGGGNGTTSSVGPTPHADRAPLDHTPPLFKSPSYSQ